MAKDTIKKRNRQGILAEDINSKLGLILEGHSALIKRFDEVDKRFDEVDKRFDEVDSKFETVFNYLSAMEPQGGKIENLDKRVIILEKQSVKSK
ncbi:MAG TPA: hypothetical protein P5274_00870 [Candidatus Paceibacterota bacterium]|nr:hypothetical protein [Candidatus Paceibacterota bacterium]